MRRVCALFGVLMWLAAVGAGPAQAADREHQQMMAEIRMLWEQTMRLQVLLGTLTESLDAAVAKIDEHAGVNRRAFADSRLQVEAVADGVRILREKLDDTNVRISGFSQEIEAMRLAIPRVPPPDALSGELEGGGAPEAGLPAGPVAPTQPGMSPQRLYDQAWADYTLGQWSMALAGFEAYLKTFPRSALADDAQFYVGQTHFNAGSFPEAVAAFDQVIDGYPDGNTVPEALYKRGLSLDRLGETDRAQQSFQTVIDEYPDSSMAALAQQALDRLSRPDR